MGRGPWPARWHLDEGSTVTRCMSIGFVVLTGGILHFGGVAINFNPQALVEELMGCCRPKQLDEGGSNSLPTSRAELLDVAFE